MPGEGGEKTEKASPKKRQDERKKGNVFMSKDIVTVATVAISFFTLQYFVGSFVSKLEENYRMQTQRAAELATLGPGDVMQLFREFCGVFASTILPVMLVIMLAGIVVSGAQTRFLFSHEQIKFKMSRLNPLSGIKKLFSIRSLVELVKSMLKIILLTWLLYGRVRDAMARLPLMIDWDIYQAAVYTGEQIMGLIISVIIAFSAVASADYLYQWWEYEKGIKMTKQEVKDEYKQMEGNPEIKSARRQKQREFATQRMMSQVKDSDVIVRNPTHYAVALKYELEVDPAPIVLAKGKDLIALKIVDEAEKHGVATIENKPLAKGLYELSQIDGVIPDEFYQPVAELLAWLYSTREKETRKQ